MPKGNKKQPAKKRTYNRKPKLVEPLPKPKEKDKEIELLALLISVFENWTNEQKQRNLKFLCSKYYDFL